MSALAIALAFSFLLSIQASAERYLITFKSSQDFKRFHAGWTSGNQKSLKQKYFSEIKANYQIQDSLKHIGVLIVESKDESFLKQARQIEGVKVEKELFFASPKRLALDQQKQPWDFSLNSKPKANRLLVSPVVRTFDTEPSQLSSYLKSMVGWGPAAMHTKQAWALGTKGHGVRIADIDADVEVTHPALSGKIETVQDFLGNQDPQRDFGHGTQVGGVLVGAENANGFYGVAPDAKLLYGIVCGVNVCPNASIAQAINWAIEKKVDIIHMPLRTDETPVMQTALDAAEKAGIVVVASAGNHADEGPEYVNTLIFPASYKTVISVGGLMQDLSRIIWSQWSPDLSLVAAGAGIFTSVPVGQGCDAFMEVKIDGNLQPATDVACYQNTAFSAQGLNADVVYAGEGLPSDFAGQNFSGKIVITDGETSPQDAFQNSGSSTPAALIHVNGGEAIRSYVIRDSQGNSFPIPIINTKLSDGRKIIDALKAGGAVQAKITVKPLDYAPQAGTSMSSPMVAGVVALMRSVNPQLTPAQVKSILMSTATSLEPGCEGKCGAGLADAAKAVDAARNQH